MKKKIEEKLKVYFIVGQTATGKSVYAVKLAKKINGEIISADSRQVYKGLNIGTGKITKKEMSGIPHYLLDVVSPKKVFNVADFKKLAEKKIAEIITRGKTPIIVGGTGFYINALLYNQVFPEVKPNLKLRKELEKKSVQQLFKILKKIDKDRAEKIDAKNPVRLIRAIEIARSLGKVPEINEKDNLENKYDIKIIGLKMSDEKLKKKIASRLSFRIKKEMFQEIKKLHDKGLSWKRMENLGLEYRYGSRYLRGIISKDECIETLKKEIWAYAKRQKTWFKRNGKIEWVEVK